MRKAEDQDEVVQGPRMPDQRKITAAIMKAWAPHIAARALGADPRSNIMYSRLLTQTIPSLQNDATLTKKKPALRAGETKNRRYVCRRQNTLRRFFFGEGLHHFEDSGAGAPARRRRRPREETGATEGGGNT